MEGDGKQEEILNFVGKVLCKWNVLLITTIGNHILAGFFCQKDNWIKPSRDALLQSVFL